MGVVSAAAPALAAPPPARSAAAVAGDPADQPSTIAASAAEAAREHVLRLAKSGLPAEIRASAWNALRNTRGDAAIAEWLAPGGGYDLAKQRLRDTRVRNRALCERVVATHTVGFSPEVRVAAERALKGTDTDRAGFVKTGYAEAQQRDRVAREADAQHRLEIAERDRQFVRRLAEQEPGEHVRVAAQWAVRPGATDTDIAEFLGYGWASGAALDLEAYRLRIADAEVRRHHALSGLIEVAVAAERDLATAADAARARAEAERAWRAVADNAGAARAAWLAEQETARAQAERWRDIARVSRESADALWTNITALADVRQGDWTKEQADAAEAAVFWKEVFDRALAGELRGKG
ncbi:hypothetical protein ACFV4Q_36115 [Streptomyces nojiriensis]|uniref:hypothetical protein n=1 Tax=Streptomyces nojiriensis TaxID=66374 RepID=UPI003662E5C9